MYPIKFVGGPADGDEFDAPSCWPVSNVAIRANGGYRWSVARQRYEFDQHIGQVA